MGVKQGKTVAVVMFLSDFRDGVGVSSTTVEYAQPPLEMAASQAHPLLLIVRLKGSRLLRIIISPVESSPKSHPSFALRNIMSSRVQSYTAVPTRWEHRILRHTAQYFQPAPCCKYMHTYVLSNVQHIFQQWLSRFQKLLALQLSCVKFNGLLVPTSSHCHQSHGSLSGQSRSSRPTSCTRNCLLE